MQLQFCQFGRLEDSLIRKYNICLPPSHLQKNDGFTVNFVNTQ